MAKPSAIEPRTTPRMMPRRLSHGSGAAIASLAEAVGVAVAEEVWTGLAFCVVDAIADDENCEVDDDVAKVDDG